MRGSAAHQLKYLVQSKNVHIKAVVLNKGEVKNKKKYYKRKIKKTIKIGLFGAINGMKMRKWYSTGTAQYLNVEPIDKICSANNIPLKITPTINCQQTIDCFKNANADLGLSLGNGYIGSKIFKVPKWGMINIHHEELPAYQNAQSIIWQIYNGSRNTGYTIHKIDKHIDTGEILFQEKMPIEFRADLADTVSYNYAQLWDKSAHGLAKVLDDFNYYYENSTAQGHGDSYTTPSFFQFLKIKRQFKKLKREAA